DRALDPRLEGLCEQRELAVDDHLAVGDIEGAVGFHPLGFTREDQAIALPAVLDLGEVVAVGRQQLMQACFDLFPGRWPVDLVRNRDAHGCRVVRLSGCRRGQPDNLTTRQPSEVPSVRGGTAWHSAMLSKVWSAATLGIDAVRITIEVDAAQASQPGFTLVG